MDTTIRKANRKFYGDAIFSHGLSRSGYFNRRESIELEEYGHTFSDLANGSLIPTNDDEHQFVEQLSSNSQTVSYPVQLWRKYLAALEKSKVHHGFAKSNAKNTPTEDLSTEAV